MKTFETKKDRVRQKAALIKFCTHFEIDFKERVDFANIDAALYKNNQLIGFAEVKGVHKNISEKENVIVSMRKIVKAQKLQTYHKVPVAIIWMFNDFIVYERINNLRGIFYYGGRKERVGSSYDQEMIIKVLIKNLITL